MNPKAYIIARSESHESEQKLRLAGAQRVISPYAIGAPLLEAGDIVIVLADEEDLSRLLRPEEVSTFDTGEGPELSSA